MHDFAEGESKVAEKVILNKNCCPEETYLLSKEDNDSVFYLHPFINYNTLYIKGDIFRNNETKN